MTKENEQHWNKKPKHAATEGRFDNKSNDYGKAKRGRHARIDSSDITGSITRSSKPRPNQSSSSNAAQQERPKKRARHSRLQETCRIEDRSVLQDSLSRSKKLHEEEKPYLLKEKDTSPHDNLPLTQEQIQSDKQERSLAKAQPEKARQPQATKKPMQRWQKILLGVLIAIVVVALACLVAAGIYLSQLDSALALDPEKEASVSAVLTPAPANEPFYMLILGSDSREGSGTSTKEDESGDNERSDLMMLVRVDASTRQVTMVSIPRDTPTKLEDGRTVKINEVYNLGGPAYSIKAVSELTGVPISHFAEIHFSEFEQLVDDLGGVTVNVSTKLEYKDALTGETVAIEPGTQTLNGQQAQIFARVRKAYGDDQEAKRQNNNRQLMEAIVKKVLEKPITEMPGAVLSAAECVQTDIGSDDLISLLMPFMSSQGSMTMYSVAGPSKGDFNQELGGVWFCYDNPEGWAQIMDVVDAGEDPSGLDVEGTAIIPGWQEDNPNQEEQQVAA